MLAKATEPPLLFDADGCKVGPDGHVYWFSIASRAMREAIDEAIREHFDRDTSGPMPKARERADLVATILHRADRVFDKEETERRKLLGK